MNAGPPPLTMHIQQASSAFTLSDVEAMYDFTVALARGADVTGFTEVAQRHDVLRRACRLTSHHLLLPAQGDTALAVRESHKVLQSGEMLSVPGVKGPAAQGGHGPRSIQWVAFQPFGYGEHVTSHVGHWVTRKADLGRQQTAMTDDLAHAVRDHSHGSRIGFWQGDTNNPDRPHDLTSMDAALAKGDLTSCWDELGHYPETEGALTLDIIGSYDPDKRVSCTRARRWPPAHSDHRAVSAWYKVAHPRGRG